MDDNKKVILPAVLGQSQNLAELVEYSQDSIVSKTILDKPVGNLTVFAFDKGQRLSEHTSPYDATVVVLDGAASIIIAGKKSYIFLSTHT